MIRGARVALVVLRISTDASRAGGRALRARVDAACVAGGAAVSAALGRRSRRRRVPRSKTFADMRAQRRAPPAAFRSARVSAERKIAGMSAPSDPSAVADPLIV